MHPRRRLALLPDANRRWTGASVVRHPTGVRWRGSAIDAKDRRALLRTKDFKQSAFIAGHDHSQGYVRAIELKAVIAKKWRKRTILFRVRAYLTTSLPRRSGLINRVNRDRCIGQRRVLGRHFR